MEKLSRTLLFCVEIQLLHGYNDCGKPIQKVSTFGQARTAVVSGNEVVVLIKGKDVFEKYLACSIGGDVE